MPDPASPAAPPSDPQRDLRAALAGVRALLLDLDGVIIVAGKPVPGSPEALAALVERGIPFRIVTNTSMVSRTTLARWSATLGAGIPPARFHSALSAAAEWAARRHPDGPLYVLASDDAKTEFEGQRLLSHEEASRADATAAAVIIGDSPEDATWDNLNRAFRLVRNGAELVGMHKNRWWLTPDGPTLDSGAFVAGLEYAASIRAHTVGKPSPDFFRLAAEDLAADFGVGGPGRARRPLRRREIAMVGDDLWSDVLAAQRVGIRGVLVLSGKHGEAELAQAEADATRRSRDRHDGRAGDRRGRPDAVAASLAEVVEALSSDG